MESKKVPWKPNKGSTPFLIFQSNLLLKIQTLNRNLSCSWDPAPESETTDYGFFFKKLVFRIKITLAD